MRRAVAPLSFAALLLVALLVGLAAGGAPPPSTVPSVHNRGPQGLAVLYRWLEAGGRVGTTEAPLTSIPEETTTLVLAAPSAAPVSPEEVASLRDFVGRGGTLVYLASRPRRQPDLERWLGVSEGPALPAVLRDEGDPLGATALVRVQGGLTHGVRALRLRAERTVAVADGLMVAERGALWLRRHGRGEVWVASGADLAESARLELLDNAAFWANLEARGPLLFDEGHHRAGPDEPQALHVWGLALQLSLVAVAFIAARGARLGPPREGPRSAHRSALEYVDAMAALTRSAGLDHELVHALKERARQLASQRAGVPLELSWDEAQRALQEADDAAGRQFQELGQAVRVLPASRALARLERRLLGLTEAGGDQA